MGSSSLYKRETYPNGVVPKGSVTATWAGKGNSRDGYNGLDPFKQGAGVLPKFADTYRLHVAHDSTTGSTE